ncbi:MAG: ORF6N domain-containing protein [Paludibacteraceae bacterium]|nr:ORF6N domain-containing protein [Paludibacteraceae bacterium]
MIPIEVTTIQNRILLIRNQQVMIDRDIAELYGVETKVLNQAVKRNADRFPDRFMFQLTKEEQSKIDSSSLRSQFVTLKKNDTDNLRGKHSKYLSYAFTEQGVAMLSSVLRSPTAVQVSVKIMDAFVAMRRFLMSNAQIFQRLDSLEIHRIESDKRIDELFTRMDRYKIDDTQGIFFQGQIFDAYAKFQSFIAQAQKEIVLIDNYVDITVLERLSTKNSGVDVTIYTLPNTRLTTQDVRSFNAQYPTLTVRHTTSMHDRFLIIDNSILYHLGASLKDLGRKCFAFELFDSGFIPDILAKVI